MKKLSLLLILVMSVFVFSCDKEEKIDPPVADFDATYITNPLEVTFTSTSTNAKTFAWSFGDGETSVEESPVHLYAADGLYEVKLIVENASGTDSLIVNLNVSGDLTVTATMGAGYANDVFYSLKNGVAGTAPRTNWDIAFSTIKLGSSIIINDGAGAELYVYPLTKPTDANWDWNAAIDISTMSSTVESEKWTKLYNSTENWEDGAFARNATGHPNYGWGVYDMATHNLSGVTLYVLKTVAGTYKKIWIENKLSSANIYKFRISDIDGSNSKTVEVDCSLYTTKNYIYYSVATNKLIDREPAKDTWDLLFTKYYDESIPYVVTGALNNIGTEGLKVENVTDRTEFKFTNQVFENKREVIGSKWKSYSMAESKWSLQAQWVFFVKTQHNDVYKLYFTNFDGSTTGTSEFVKKFQTVVSE